MMKEKLVMFLVQLQYLEQLVIVQKKHPKFIIYHTIMRILI